MAISTTTNFPQSNLTDYSYPNVIAGGTITTGTLTAGAVLGRINTSAGTPAYGDNTGDGTIGTISLGAQATGGIYNLICTTGGSGSAARFTLTDPLGNVISTVIASGSQQTTTHLVFTITAGTVAFVIGDVITVPVLAGNYKLSASAAGDGSAVPDCILLEDVDASSQAKLAPVLKSGKANIHLLTYGTGHSAGTVVSALRTRGIHVTYDFTD